MRKIISHKDPRHFDDYLAIAVLKAQYPEAEIEYYQPQAIPVEYLEADDVAIVDAGGRYEPEKLNFDHHQNIDIPSSVILVLEHTAKISAEELLQKHFLYAIDFIDRFGINKALQEGVVAEDKELGDIRKVILQTPITENTAKIVADTLKEAIDNNYTYSMFLYTLQEGLKNTPEYKQAEETIRKMEEDYQRIKNSVKEIEIDGIRVLYTDQTVAPNVFRLFSETKADILIERNSMNKEQTSIVANTSKQNLDDIYRVRDKIIENEPIVFIHKNNFIAVLDKKPEEIAEKLEDLSIQNKKSFSLKR